MIKKHRFDNGFTFVYQKSTNQIPITHVNVICDMGPIYEKDKMRGVSHLIEHMCYKGTKKIPKSFDLYTEYDNYGAFINATTTKRYTMYKVKCEDIYSKHCIHLLSDMMLNSTFDKKEFEKEHHVVIEESIKNEEEPDYIMNTMSDALVYKNTPFEFQIDCVAYHKKGNLKYEDIITTYHDLYIPSNMILSVVTNLSFDFFIKLLKTTYFNGSSNVQQIMRLHSNKQYIKRSSNQKGIQYNIKPTKKMDITNISIAFRVCSQYSTNDKYVLDIISHLLGGYFSSILFSVLREENGLTYSTDTHVEYNECMGSFTIYALTDPNKLIKNGTKKGVLPIIIDILNNMIIKGITSSQLAVAKNNLRGNYKLQINDDDEISIYNCEKTLLFPNETIIPFQNIYDTYYKDITSNNVNDVIRRYFIRNNMNVCILGEIKANHNIIQNVCEKLVEI